MLQDADAGDVQEIIDNLLLIKDEKLNADNPMSIHHLARVGMHRSYLRWEFDPQDVMDALIERFSSKTRRYRSARVKYRFTDLDGNLCEWSGQGREPIKLRKLLSATGMKREDFLVQKEHDDEDLLQQAVRIYSKHSEERVPLSDSQIRLLNYTMQIEEQYRTEEESSEQQQQQDNQEFVRHPHAMDDKICEY